MTPLIFSFLHGREIRLLEELSDRGIDTEKLTLSVLLDALGAAGVDESETPSMKRLVRESGRPVPRHVATSMTDPGLSLPRTIF